MGKGGHAHLRPGRGPRMDQCHRALGGKAVGRGGDAHLRPALRPRDLWFGGGGSGYRVLHEGRVGGGAGIGGGCGGCPFTRTSAWHGAPEGHLQSRILP